MTEAEPTFCGDLDAETGDCDLMFLAEEPADNRTRGRRKEGKFKLEERFLPFIMMTQHESCKHTHTELRGPVA